ncbi:Beclin family [Penicillium bovifimosum]|uniref:Beclin family n=1 Tax=Penicillium bovifimosum TaxID=126998 RepID=A0A9W9KY16_9EURO|nr:Beclin family [Penicillium bovifimosum]KAJ5124931.1 Beclin family [Penicillium bovifimosum]
MYCQKCRTPLKLDGSVRIKAVISDPANQAMGLDSTGKTLSDTGATSSARSAYPPEHRDKYDQSSKHATLPVYRRSIPAPRAGGQHNPPTTPRADSGNMSFVMLTESQVTPPPVADSSPASGSKHNHTQAQTRGQEDGSIVDQIEKTTRLFEIVSARSDIDHPICVECTELLVESLQKRLAGSTKERDAYISFLRNLNGSIPTAEELQAAEKSLNESLEAERATFAELQSFENEKAALDAEIASLENDSRRLDADEENFWRSRNAFALTLTEFQNERDALNMRYDHDSQQLERLQRTNVYNDAFCIGHDGYFGTINGLRLGRLANPSVDWPEINAAWGQTALLLATMAEKLGFQFQGYRLRPLGSNSRIDKVEYPVQPSGQPVEGAAPKVTQLDLFSSGDLPLNLPWLHRRFDSGMVAFLECLRQLGKFVEKTPTPVINPRRGQTGATAPGLKLPYEIKRDRIGDASIKLGFNQNDETWTRACKYTLTCCKFLLAHASNLASTGSSNSAAVAAAAVAAADQARQPGSPAKDRP